MMKVIKYPLKFFMKETFRTPNNITGTKHDFPFINIRKVSREVLKTEDKSRGFLHFPRDHADVNE